MEIRKSTFDYSPSLIEYEGNYIRINFDVEQIELENSMDSSEGKKLPELLMPHTLYVLSILWSEVRLLMQSSHPLIRPTRCKLSSITISLILPKLRMGKSSMPMTRNTKLSITLCRTGARRRRL